MKIVKFLIYALNSFLVMIILSCENDNNNNPMSEVRFLPSIIKSYSGAVSSYSSQTIYRFTYDDQNRFSSITYQPVPMEIDVNLPLWTSIFEYSGNTIIVTESSSLASDTEYQPIVKTTKYNRIDNQIFINDSNPITIDNNQRIVGPVYDKNGNTISYTNYSLQELTVKYDDMNGVFRYVNMPSWYITSQLNILSEGGLNMYNNCTAAMITKDMDSEKAPGYGYKMEYNNDGYPTKITEYLINIIANGFGRYEIQYTNAK